MKYDTILAQLKEHQDETYRKFNEGLIPGAEGTSLGVRIPVLRQIAKEIFKEDWRGFLQQSQGEKLYEIVMLRGLVIAGAKCDFSEKLRLFDGFVPEIQNWSVCDCVCSSMKDVKMHLDETWNFLTPYGQSREEFPLRVYIILLMDYFLVDAYIDPVLDILFTISQETYYVKMAQAWAIATAMAKYRDRVLPRLETKTLSAWVQNKTIQKCRESFRISDADKAYLQSLKKSF